ncbi:MAG TPA: cell division protein FtsQ/DivIB [Dongiaceae bacterium]|nr:cell division protein FtsQ/DivIB [Dongiaceae bacterium]
MRRLEAPAVKIARGRGNPVTARTALPPRKRPQPAWLRWSIRFGIGFGACVIVGGGALWGVQSGWLQREWAVVSDAALNATADLGLSLQTVEVHGRGETKQKDILGALGAPRGAALLGLDIEAMRERLAALPWIVSAEIERRYPDRLVVTVKEAEPLALWQRQQKLFLVSRTGKVIETADLRKYSRLLVIVGDDAPERAEGLFDLLAQQPKLKERVTAAVFVGKRRWNLRFDNGVDVKLPEENPGAAWSRLAELQNQHGILERDVRIIDLRLPDQVVVRRAHPAQPEDQDAPAGDKPKDKAT